MCTFSLVSQPGSSTCCPGGPNARQEVTGCELRVRCGGGEDMALSAEPPRGFPLCPHASPGSRFASARRGESLSAGWLQPPPARPLRRRRQRHSPASGRSWPPPRPRCWPGSTPRPPPPRGTCAPQPGQTPTSDPPLRLPCSSSGADRVEHSSESPRLRRLGMRGHQAHRLH